MKGTRLPTVTPGLVLLTGLGFTVLSQRKVRPCRRFRLRSFPELVKRNTLSLRVLCPISPACVF